MSNSPRSQLFEGYIKSNQKSDREEILMTLPDGGYDAHAMRMHARRLRIIGADATRDVINLGANESRAGRVAFDRADNDLRGPRGSNAATFCKGDAHGGSTGSRQRKKERTRQRERRGHVNLRGRIRRCRA